MVRCPEPIKDDVQRFINDWKLTQLGESPQSAANDERPAPGRGDVAAALAVLEAALTMRANAGGAIKAEIRRAITLLE